MDKISVSVIIPAFNESKRLPGFLQRIIAYCQNSDETYEIIIVDDGSVDDTYEVAGSYKNKFPALGVVKIKKNMGKGYAVKEGLLKAIGEICVFMDADGSVRPVEIKRNLHFVKDGGYDIFIGSRVIRSKARVLKVRWLRKFAGAIFNYCVKTFLLTGIDIKDTQCGFKMFKREVVKPIFSKVRLRGFGFDMEALYLANKMGYRIKEGPVSWRHVSGSKVNLLMDSIKMFINIFQIRKWHED